ncbi:MAG: helix-turn-helix domain-containing protein [Ilumatobacter sp.]
MATALVDLLPAVAALADPKRTVDLAQVGALAGLSSSRVQRVFTEVLGTSPKHFGRTVRLDVAAILLIATDDRVIDVAFSSGFRSHEGFTRAFQERFGQSPTAWRQQRRGAIALSEANQAIATSRCVRLHHRSVLRKEPTMAYDIDTEVLTATPVLYQQRRVERDALGEVLAEVLPAVYGYVIESGLAPAGHPFVRYSASSPAFVTIDAGVPLVSAATTPPPAESGIIAGELSAGLAAVTIHKGPYDDLGDAHAALDRWIAECDHEPAGDLWELFLTDPGEVPDPAEWLTKVCWPIR